ncbi:hypothetical protein PFTANZ_02010 [Plasmodium falciparum Tanzania (2000708)]|uniref:Surface antigen n=1 Tax=Plasmodium falciparum Tanzania (2000708) TaxID=1036725 RepID=A0A024W9V3_PLAFA|nr:hypothetical protein PFTANZ_02010 [Plasmodium falciparum Tanzania (2000708)]
MKVHYINILLFALPLNILVSSKKNTYIKYNTLNTKLIRAHRTLCECELYALSNYDNDPEMKEVMQQFDRQTSQRFHEYDNRMKTTRQKCKDKCDKEVQKIILKDKLEKELNEKFLTLQTDIQNDAFPTCVCEKSMTDKVEKGCLRCGGVLGGGIAPTFGLIGSVAINMWKTTEIAAVIAAAEKFGASKGAAAGLKAGVDAVIKGLKALNVHGLCPDLFESIGTKIPYTNSVEIANFIHTKYSATCMLLDTKVLRPLKCKTFDISVGIFRQDGTLGPPAASAIPDTVEKVVAGAKGVAESTKTQVATAKTLAFETAQKGAVDVASYNLYTAIGYSVLGILIIVLIMIIIYLILRYRRKKKMKKKLQYIKLLEE